jgi:hypothetical protein
MGEEGHRVIGYHYHFSILDDKEYPIKIIKPVIPEKTWT